MDTATRRKRVSLLVLAIGILGLVGASLALATDFKGTTGPDTINATDRDDTINSGLGGDTVNAGYGDDVVSAGAGADTVDAGTASIEFPGNSPKDVAGYIGTDGSDDDSVNGGGGPDDLTGGQPNFTTIGGAFDHDTIKGGGGADVIDVSDNDGPFEDHGADTADGGRGNDRCTGDPNDVFRSCETVTIVP